MVHGKWSKQQNFQSLQALVPQYYKYGNYLFNKLPFKNSNLQNLDKSINLEDSTECPHKGIIKNDSKNLSSSSHNHQALTIIKLSQSSSSTIIKFSQSSSSHNHHALHLIIFQCFYILIVLISWPCLRSG